MATAMNTLLDDLVCLANAVPDGVPWPEQYLALALNFIKAYASAASIDIGCVAVSVVADLLSTPLSSRAVFLAEGLSRHSALNLTVLINRVQLQSCDVSLLPQIDAIIPLESLLLRDRGSETENYRQLQHLAQAIGKLGTASASSGEDGDGNGNGSNWRFETIIHRLCGTQTQPDSRLLMRLLLRSAPAVRRQVVRVLLALDFRDPIQTELDDYVYGTDGGRCSASAAFELDRLAGLECELAADAGLECPAMFYPCAWVSDYVESLIGMAQLMDVEQWKRLLSLVRCVSDVDAAIAQSLVKSLVDRGLEAKDGGRTLAVVLVCARAAAGILPVGSSSGAGPGFESVLLDAPSMVTNSQTAITSWQVSGTGIAIGLGRGPGRGLSGADASAKTKDAHAHEFPPYSTWFLRMFESMGVSSGSGGRSPSLQLQPRPGWEQLMRALTLLLPSESLGYLQLQIHLTRRIKFGDPAGADYIMMARTRVRDLQYGWADEASSAAAGADPDCRVDDFGTPSSRATRNLNPVIGMIEASLSAGPSQAQAGHGHIQAVQSAASLINAFRRSADVRTDMEMEMEMGTELLATCNQAVGLAPVLSAVALCAEIVRSPSPCQSLPDRVAFVTSHTSTPLFTCAVIDILAIAAVRRPELMQRISRCLTKILASTTVQWGILGEARMGDSDTGGMSTSIAIADLFLMQGPYLPQPAVTLSLLRSKFLCCDGLRVIDDAVNVIKLAVCDLDFITQSEIMCHDGDKGFEAFWTQTTEMGFLIAVIDS